MASVYNMSEYESDDESIMSSVSLPKPNLDAAAAYITDLLEQNGVDYALMGGYALSISGNERSTNNIDIVVDTAMEMLWTIITSESRVVIPKSRLVADVMRFYVCTGRGYNGECAEDNLVEVELIMAGSNGSPRDISNHQQLVKSGGLGTLWKADKSASKRSLKVLDVLYLLRHKLEAVAHRGAAKDLHDAGFIVERWPLEVEKVQWVLDEEFQGEMQKSKLNFRKLLGQSAASTESTSVPVSIESRPSAEQHCTYSAGTSIACVDRSSDGRRAVIAGSKVFKIIRIDGQTITEDLDLRAALIAYATTHDPGSATADQLYIRAIKWSHDVMDSTIITACGNGRITVYDLKRGAEGFEVASLQEHARQIHRIAINPFKCNWLLTASQDGTVKSFDLRGTMAGRNGPTIPRQTFKCNADAVRDVSWSPTDGMEFACCTDAGVVQKWDIRKPTAPVLKITAHQSPCFSISWHPDGEHLISGGSDQHCYVWNLSKNAERNQKPKYSFVTPAPVAQVVWRPPTWSNTAQTRRAAQVAVSYDDANSNRMPNSSVHIWDVARSALPFKEIEHWEAAPRGLLWNSRDILWSVSKDGHFVQSDVAFSPRVIDRRGLSTFSMSPTGEIAMLLEGRQFQKRNQLSMHSLTSTPSVSYTSSSGQMLSLSRSDSEEDVVGSFLAPKQRRGHRRRLSGRATLPLSTTPPSAMTLADNKLMSLENAVRVTGQYIPQQTMATGHPPAPHTVAIHRFMSRRYLLHMRKAIGVEQNKPTNLRLLSTMEYYARSVEHLGYYRLAQTWRLLAFTINLLITRRASYHRKSRLAIKDKEKGHNKGSPEPVDHTAERNSETSAKAKKDVAFVASKDADVKTLSAEKIESTSNVVTPLVRPINDTLTDQMASALATPLAEPDAMALTPSMVGKSSPTPIPVPGTDHVSNSSRIEGHDYCGTAFRSGQIEVDAPPPKKLLQYDLTEQVARQHAHLSRHDSGESFQMFSDTEPGQSLGSTRCEPRSVPSNAQSLGQSVSNWENSLQNHGIMVPAPPAASESSDDFTTPPKFNETRINVANGRPHTLISPPMLRLQEASADYAHTGDRPRSASNLSDDPNITADDCLPWPDDPSFVISPIDPTILIQRTIDYEAQTGSMNATTLILLLRPYLPAYAIPNQQALSILRQQHTRLMQMKLFTTAALLRNLCVPLYPSVFSTSQAHTSVGFFCTSCLKPLDNDPLIPESEWRCPRCLQAIEGCAVCHHREIQEDMGYENHSGARETPKQSSMWWLCPGCGHGGHMICMQAWHDGSEFLQGDSYSGGCCPLEGCLHPCLPGQWRETIMEQKKALKEREMENTVKETVRSLGGVGCGVTAGVRRDLREVRQSKAVDGVRLALGMNSRLSAGSVERKRSVKRLAADEGG